MTRLSSIAGPSVACSRWLGNRANSSESCPGSPSTPTTAFWLPWTPMRKTSRTWKSVKIEQRIFRVRLKAEAGPCIHGPGRPRRQELPTPVHARGRASREPFGRATVRRLRRRQPPRDGRLAPQRPEILDQASPFPLSAPVELGLRVHRPRPRARGQPPRDGRARNPLQRPVVDGQGPTHSLQPRGPTQELFP